MNDIAPGIKTFVLEKKNIELKIWNAKMSNAMVCTQVLNFKMEKADFSNVAALLHSPSSADAVIRIQSGFAPYGNSKMAWREYEG